MENYKIAEDVVSKTVNEEEFLLKLDPGVYFGLNACGSFIWNEIKNGSSKEDIVTKGCETFEVSNEEFLRDFDALIDDFRKNQLLV